MGGPKSGCEETRISETKRVAPLFCDSETLDKVVAELQELRRRTGIDRTLAIGELVLNKFFGGDPKLWRDHRRNKNNSIRRLAERSDCPFCKSALNEAVGVYVAVDVMPSVRSLGHITASHIACVLALPPDERRIVLEDAERGAWSVREIRQRVVDLRRTEGERHGRPAVFEEERIIALLMNSVRRLGEAVSRVTDLARTSKATRCTLVQVTTDLSRHVESIEECLSAHVPSSRRGSVILID